MVIIMKFSEWITNYPTIKENVVNRLKILFNIQDVPNALFTDINLWLGELYNLDLMYSEEYTNNFMENEIYEFTVQNYLLYIKLNKFNEDGGFSEVDKEDIKNSYSMGGFDLDNQDLATGALRNDHSSVNKNKISNIDAIKKIKNLISLEKDKFLNKIKECLVIIW